MIGHRQRGGRPLGIPALQSKVWTLAHQREAQCLQCADHPRPGGVYRELPHGSARRFGHEGFQHRFIHVQRFGAKGFKVEPDGRLHEGLFGAGGPVHRVFLQSGPNCWLLSPGSGRPEAGQQMTGEPERPAALPVHLASMGNADDLDGTRTVINLIHDPVIAYATR
jgi:hypothetical protein